MSVCNQWVACKSYVGLWKHPVTSTWLALMLRRRPDERAVFSVTCSRIFEMNRRTTAQMEDDDVMDLEGSVTQLSKQNAKMERLMSKIGTQADNSEFRDMLASERKSATHLTKQILSHMKSQRIRGVVVGQFEREYKRFTNTVERIDLKQKQQLVALSHRDHDPTGEQILREEEAYGGSSHSLKQDQLQESEIEFLEYNVNEIEQRHLQIRAVESDIREMAEMWKDLQTLVEEQQVHIDVIDTAIVETKDKVVAAHKELEQAADYQSRARKRACCTAVLLIIIVAVVVVVVLVLKKSI